MSLTPDDDTITVAWRPGTASTPGPDDVLLDGSPTLTVGVSGEQAVDPYRARPSGSASCAVVDLYGPWPGGW